MASEYDLELLAKVEEKRQKFVTEMIESRILYLEDKTNDYNLFIYLATMLNFIEAHNGGCLSEVGMMSLRVNISSVLDKLITCDTNNKITQRELVTISLNLLNSYTVGILVKGMFEIAKEEPEGFFQLNDFPIPIRNEFEELNERVTELIPKLKLLLDTYTPHMDKEHKKVFTVEKNNGFFKQIFDAKAVKTGSMSGLERAVECK